MTAPTDQTKGGKQTSFERIVTAFQLSTDPLKLWQQERITEAIERERRAAARAELKWVINNSVRTSVYSELSEKNETSCALLKVSLDARLTALTEGELDGK